MEVGETLFCGKNTGQNTELRHAGATKMPLAFVDIQWLKHLKMRWTGGTSKL